MNIADVCCTLVRESGDAIIVCDAEGAIRFWNRSAERIFGFAEADALGRSLDIIIPPTLRARHDAGYARTMRTGTSRYGAGDLLAVPALHSDGRRLSIEFTITPIRGSAGEMQGIAAIIRDATARFEELRRLRRQAGALAKDGGERAT